MRRRSLGRVLMSWWHMGAFRAAPRAERLVTTLHQLSTPGALAATVHHPVQVLPEVLLDRLIAIVIWFPPGRLSVRDTIGASRRSIPFRRW